MQWTAATSSKRLRQTVQNFLLWCVGSDQQCATGFLIKNGAIPEHGVTTLVTHFSWTIKLHTAKKKEKYFTTCMKESRLKSWRRKKLSEIVCEVMLSIDVWIFQCEFSLSHSQRRCVDLFFPWKCGRMTSTKTACISPCQWHAHEWHYFLYTILFTIKKPSVFLNLLLALSHSLSLIR